MFCGTPLNKRSTTSLADQPVGLGQERPDGYKEAPLLTLGSTAQV